MIFKIHLSPDAHPINVPSSAFDSYEKRHHPSHHPKNTQPANPKTTYSHLSIVLGGWQRHTGGPLNLLLSSGRKMLSDVGELNAKVMSE